jgi:hypothetical protein
MFSTETKVVLAKLEDPAGTAVGLTATDYDIPIFDGARISASYGSERTGALASGSFAESGMVSGLRTGTMSFVTEVTKSATAPTVAPNWYKFMHCAGFRDHHENITDASLIFDGIANCKTMTIGAIFYESCGTSPKGIKETLRGAVNNPTINFEVGKALKISHNVSGALQDPEDVASGARLAYSGDTIPPVVMLGGTYSVDGVTRIIKSGSLAMGNTHEFSRDATKTGGVAQAFNAKISPVLTLVVQSGVLATQDFHDAILSNAELANGVTLNFDGYSFVFDGVQVTDRQDGADGTVMGETITLVFNQKVSIKMIQEA